MKQMQHELSANKMVQLYLRRIFMCRTHLVIVWTSVQLSWFLHSVYRMKFKELI